MMAGWIRRRRWWVGGGVAVVVSVALAVALWPSSSRRGLPLPPPRARVYTAFDACLLTDDQGVAGSQAAPVWAGMEKASAATGAKVSYLAVSGPDTSANASIFINTLLVRNCDVLVAVGSNEVRAALSAAGAYPARHFVVVGAGKASNNVAVVLAGSDVSGSVAAVVRSAASGNFSGGVVSVAS